MTTTTLPVNKLYIDSQFKTIDSVSDSQFKIQLPISLDFPEHTFFVLDDINIPRTWQTIETGINDRIYLELYQMTNYPNTPMPLYLVIGAGNYTGQKLADEIKSNLSNAFASDGINTVDLSVDLNVMYIYSTNTIRFHLTGAGAFRWNARVLTDYDLTQPGQPFYQRSISTIPSMNDVFRNYGVSQRFDRCFYTGFLNLVLCTDVYLVSPNLGTFDTLTVTGEQGVIKKIPITGDYGTVILDKVQSIYDQLECSRVTLTTIEFHLKDAKGRYIPLHGATISFTIIFMKGD